MVALVCMLLCAAAPATSFVDARDGQSYRRVRLGGREWMAENLRFQSPDSRCYEGAVRNCLRWGRLYRQFEAMTSCPSGWRLPSDRDWMELERAVGVPAEELATEHHRGLGSGERLKPGGGSGFDALYAGYSDPHEGGAYKYAGRTAAFWTSTPAGADDVSELAWHRDVDIRRTGIYRSKVNVTYRLPVRCVRNDLRTGAGARVKRANR